MLLLFRQQQSYLLSCGHVQAKLYTPAQLADECELATERNNALLAKGIVGLQMCMASLLDKKASTNFQKYIKSLTGS